MLNNLLDVSELPEGLQTKLRSRCRDTPRFEEIAEIGFEFLEAGPPPQAGVPETLTERVLTFYRDYLEQVADEDREALILRAARHILKRAIHSGQPLLRDTACRAVLKCTMPRIMELCHPSNEDYGAVRVPYHDNGLFANVLQLLDALLLARPGATVLVDWQRKGAEGHFQYGPAGFDLFEHLFEQTDRCHSVAEEPFGRRRERVVEQPKRVNCVFMNMLRGFLWTLPDEDLDRFRRGYKKAMERALIPVDPILEKVDQECSQWPQGARVVGVHKRLDTREVAACQLSQRAPHTSEFIENARAVLATTPPHIPQVIFLASDDAAAVKLFQKAFPRGGKVQLMCRSGVKRSDGGVREDGIDNEVHRRPCEVQDAEDVLIDSLLLSRCEDLICIDSNVAIFAALYNPELRLHAFCNALPDDWEELSCHPRGTVYDTYRVVGGHSVFVSELPSAASELIGAKLYGQLVQATGRMWDGWVELTEGGWMKIAGAGGPGSCGGWTLEYDGAGGQVMRRGLGELLVPAGRPLRRAGREGLAPAVASAIASSQVFYTSGSIRRNHHRRARARRW